MTLFREQMINCKNQKEALGIYFCKCYLVNKDLLLKWFGYNYFFNFCGTWYANSHFTSCLQPGVSLTMIWILPRTSSLTDFIKAQTELELGQVNSSR